MNQFIKTNDQYTKELLKHYGFHQVDEDINGLATFLNDQKKLATFESNNLKFTYSNILCV